MDITKTVVSLRETALLYGDYATYHKQLSGKLLKSRHKLALTTTMSKNAKFRPKPFPVAEQIAENHEHLRLQLLTAERDWAWAMMLKARPSAEAKGLDRKTKRQIVTSLGKGAKIAERLFETLCSDVSGANDSDVLEARAYAALLRGGALFENQSWEQCLKSYAVAHIIYGALSTSTKGDIFKDLLADTIDPSIRYAAYQAKIPRTEPIPTIARNAFAGADAALVERIRTLNPAILEHGDVGAGEGRPGAEAAPQTITWRSREVKIEDAAIAVAWAAVGSARSRLSEKLSSDDFWRPKDKAAAYDEVLTASQDAVDATKQAIDELKAEGVPQSDSRMQSLQITRTAVNYEMISWRIGRNRVLVGENDGSQVDFALPTTRKKAKKQADADKSKQLPPGQQIGRLKEKVVLYDGVLQSLESIKELPGVANDEELSSRLEATSRYFTALKCLAIARSHSIVGQAVQSLALIKHAFDLAEAANPVLSAVEADGDAFTPKDIRVGSEDIAHLGNTLVGELHRARALVEIFATAKTSAGTVAPSKPLSAQLLSYPPGGADLSRIVDFPPQIDVIPVKPLFLDVAWNYIEYPGKPSATPVAPVIEAAKGRERTATPEPEAAPKKKGWFGFGR